MSSNDQQAINLGMTKYDLIWKLTTAIVAVNDGAKNAYDFYKTFLQCHGLVNMVDNTRVDGPGKIDSLLKGAGITNAP
jgi:hypothetical protein